MEGLVSEQSLRDGSRGRGGQVVDTRDETGNLRDPEPYDTGSWRRWELSLLSTTRQKGRKMCVRGWGLGFMWVPLDLRRTVVGRICILPFVSFCKSTTQMWKQRLQRLRRSIVGLLSWRGLPSYDHRSVSRTGLKTGDGRGENECRH